MEADLAVRTEPFAGRRSSSQAAQGSQHVFLRSANDAEAAQPLHRAWQSFVASDLGDPVQRVPRQFSLHAAIFAISRGTTNGHDLAFRRPRFAFQRAFDGQHASGNIGVLPSSSVWGFADVD